VKGLPEQDLIGRQNGLAKALFEGADYANCAKAIPSNEHRVGLGRHILSGPLEDFRR
jgi:hypothetical protein